MKRIYTHQNFAQVGLIRSLLEGARVPSITRNEHLASLSSFQSPDLWPELWVADEDYLLAQSVVSEARDLPPTSFEDWTCPRCGARNEGNMGACWNCDFEIDGAGEE